MRKEQFATLYAMGSPITEALDRAGYTTKSLMIGYQLLHDPEVIQTVDNVRTYRNDKLATSIGDVLAQLQRDREFAYSLSNPAAAIAATSMIGKILGALEPGSKTPAKITIVWGGEEETGTE
jgi:hypothetical protein